MKYLKNIPYPNFSNREMLFAHLNLIGDVGHLIMSLYVQTKRGVQLHVTKELTDELADVDIKGITAEDIVPMFPSMELYFEDKELPTMLFYQRDQNFFDLVSDYMGKTYTEEKKSGSFCLEYYTDDTTLHATHLVDDMLNKWLQGDPAPTMPGYENDIEYDDTSRQFFFLIIKLLLYISIPRYEPVEISKKQLRHEGKPGVKGRPRTKIYRVSVPSRPSSQTRSSDAGDLGGAISPHRRRGHLRALKSEKFTKKKGTFIYIRPTTIHGGSLNDHIYIARTTERKD